MKLITINPAIDRYLQVNDVIVNETNFYHQSSDVFGGKAVNVAKIVSQFTEQYQLITATDDRNQIFINSELKAINKHLIKVPAVRMNYKINNNNKITEFNQQALALENCVKEELMTNLKKNVQAGEFVLFAGNMNRADMPFLVELCQSLPTNKIILDISSLTLAELKAIKPYMIKPNDEEIEKFFQVKIEDTDDYIYYGQELIKMGITEVIISQGAKGALYLSNDDQYQIGIPAGTVVNTVGSGDSFIGGYLVGQEANLSLPDILQLASSCGSMSAYTMGLATKAEILKNKDSIEVKRMHK